MNVILAFALVEIIAFALVEI